MKNISQVF